MHDLLHVNDNIVGMNMRPNANIANQRADRAVKQASLSTHYGPNLHKVLKGKQIN